MNAAALRKETAFDPAEPAPSRDEVLARYLHLREIGKQHHDNIMRFLSPDALLVHGRRLGIVKGKTFVLDNFDEMILPTDLAIHTAPPDRTRAIDRYARSVKLPPGSDEALMLEAIRNSRFAILKVQWRCPPIGLICADIAREAEVWLVDVGLESSLPSGAAFATRYYAPGPFVMTAGLGIPVGRDELDRVVEATPQLMRKSKVDTVQDRRFAEAVYRDAIKDGRTGLMRYRDPLAGDEED